MADGSGASIALGLVLSLSEKLRSSIAKIVLFSPWLDLGADSKKFTEKKVCDELYTAESMFRAAEMYTFQNNRNSPFVSPLRATKEQLRSFPPVYIQCGGKEILLNDIRSFEDLLKNNNVECKVDVWPDMMHLFQLADDLLEDAHHAFERLAAEISGIDNENIERQTYENKPRLEDSLKRTEA